MAGATFIFDGRRFTVSHAHVVAQCGLFSESPELLLAAYRVQSRVAPEAFDAFLGALCGAAPAPSPALLPGLRALAEEFRFWGLRAALALEGRLRACGEAADAAGFHIGCAAAGLRAEVRGHFAVLRGAPPGADDRAGAPAPLLLQPYAPGRPGLNERLGRDAVRATASSRAGAAAALLAGQPFRSDAAPGQSLQLHFAAPVRATHYHALADAGGGAPRSWVLEGHDGHGWVELDRRDAVAPAAAAAVLAVRRPREAARLRFALTGPNQDGSEGLNLKYFELWGAAGC
jgi:hypothetical protein